ncbi:MAG: DUF3857 domain-containing transglutaminase family protein [Acidobacteriota bacterium]|nr:DUF3857 domain-containing transglutaminase family protein [Acidobacteriota bacterium]
MNRFSRIIFVLCFVFLLSASAFAGDDLPNWLRQAAASNPPSYPKDVPAVVLQDEQQITLDSDGKLYTTKNYAVKILAREGRGYAVAHAFYLASFNKVREINGWLIRPDGSVKTFDKKTVLDIIADPDDVYNEGRLKIIDASSEVDAGFIFGFTTVTEDKPLFYQDDWHVQERLPVLLSRYALNLPSGWKASSMTFNHDEIKPQINGTSYVWELRNLAPIATEPMSPSIRNLAPRVAVRYAPENGSQAVNRVFTNWLEVSRWATALYEPQVIVDDAVAAKARELTANAKTELDKIRAVGTYVQNLQYISIDIGAGYGNGMIPRPSNMVLGRGYGDCKDKANLMRAMLKALKIEAYPVIIYSGDPTFVREEWASPDQFNHCIIAVKVSDETKTPTVMTDAKLGRLLIFDATDAFTSVGDLPDYLQGSNALIIAGENGGLIKMPITPPNTDSLERRVEVDLSAEGAIRGKINERAGGQTSTLFRRELRGLSAPQYKQAIEGWLTRGASGAQLITLTSNDKLADASFDLDVEFSAPHYAQLMQNRLLVFKPVIVGRRNGVFLTEAKRDQPVVLDSNSMKETVTFNLPQGFIVDEMPDAVTLETAFGKYKTSYEAKEGKLVFTRSLVINRTTVPVDKYSSVKDFYTKILSAEQSPVVLLKK